MLKVPWREQVVKLMQTLLFAKVTEHFTQNIIAVFVALSSTAADLAILVRGSSDVLSTRMKRLE